MGAVSERKRFSRQKFLVSKAHGMPFSHTKFQEEDIIFSWRVQ